ncbi:MAG: BrnA antitoxin family protein [Rhizobiaceae bacterium]
MSGKIVRYSVDPANLTPLTPEQKADLEALAARPDSEIDYCDIPPLDEKFWQNAIRNPYFRPTKKQLTLRLDSDLVAWFKHRSKGGRGYQTRINEALREYVIQQEKKTG